MLKQRILVAGSHGLIGGAVAQRLRDDGHDVFTLVRGRPKEEKEIAWNPDPAHGSVDIVEMENFDAIINMGGVSIGERRWTPGQKAKLWNSRVSSTEILVKAILALEHKPRVLISASAVGYYGDRGDEVLTEESSGGYGGYLADLCRMWEQVTAPATEAGVRVVNVRSGIVLAEGKGVLKEQTPLFRLCLGGRMGTGRQYTSWISIEDEVNAIIHILNTESLKGPVNVMSPFPVRNSEYTDRLAYAVNRPAKIPAPRGMITFALGAELTDEVLLASQNAMPKKLLESGFQFQDTELEEVFARIFNNENRVGQPKKQSRWFRK